MSTLNKKRDTKTRLTEERVREIVREELDALSREIQRESAAVMKGTRGHVKPTKTGQDGRVP